MTVQVVHDFTCPWCWIGLFQAQRLKKEFGVDIEWIGAELIPAEMDWPEPKIVPPPPANRPPIKSRLDFQIYVENIQVPKSDRPRRMRTHNAHLAVELAKKYGAADSLVEALYRGYWELGLNISEPAILTLATETRRPADADLLGAIERDEGAENIIHFDQPAYERGIYHVPTFIINGEYFAEQPYGELKAAMERTVGCRL